MNEAPAPAEPEGRSSVLFVQTVAPGRQRDLVRRRRVREVGGQAAADRSRVGEGGSRGCRRARLSVGRHDRTVAGQLQHGGDVPRAFVSPERLRSVRDRRQCLGVVRRLVRARHLSRGRHPQPEGARFGRDKVLREVPSTERRRPSESQIGTGSTRVTAHPTSDFVVSGTFLCPIGKSFFSFGPYIRL